MRRIPPVGPAFAATCLFLLLASAPVSAAPITGKLDSSGYTVIALAANGQARTVVATDGNFRLEPPDASATLHLRAANGTYAGPIVLAERGGEVAEARAAVKRAKRKVRRARRKVRAARVKRARADDRQAKRAAKKRLRRAKRRLKRKRRKLHEARARLAQAQREEAERPNRAILGVRSGAPLGPIQVRSDRGYAITGAIAERWLDTAKLSRARDGVPIGAGVFGRVVSPLLPSAVPGDSDVDGVPNVLDIDDDGDLILDDLDHSVGAAAAQSSQQFHISSLLVLPIQFTVNVNAGSTDQEIEDGLANTAGEHSGGRLAIEPVSGDAPAELDCGGTDGLVYCSPGGTGRAFQAGVEFSQWPRFPDEFDSDGDGFGTLDGVVISHGATSDQIRTGDVLVQRVLQGGTENLFTATIQYIFVTGPALVSWRDTAGNSGKVSYPASTDPMTVAPGSDGDIVLTLTLWRPQRKRIPADPAPGPGDSATWTDIGGLNYIVTIANVEDAGPSSGAPCPPSAFSTDDPNLTPLPADSPNGGFVDLATDRPANPANTLTYTLNASKCVEGAGFTWNPGKTVSFNLTTTTETGAIAEQGGVPFRRAGP